MPDSFESLSFCSVQCGSERGLSSPVSFSVAVRCVVEMPDEITAAIPVALAGHGVTISDADAEAVRFASLRFKPPTQLRRCARA
jgi:hypothetical protein